MEKHLNVLNQALNKANQSGAFTLQESAIIAQSLEVVAQIVQNQAKASPIEQAREEARNKRQTEPLENQNKGTEAKDEAPMEVVSKDTQEKSN